MSGLSSIPGVILARRRSWLVALLFILVAGGIIGGIK